MENLLTTKLSELSLFYVVFTIIIRKVLVFWEKKFHRRNLIWKYLRRRVADLRATWDKNNLLEKNFIYFSKKKLFLYFGKWNFLVLRLKNCYIFSKKEFLYFKKELAQPERQKQIHSKRISYIFSKKVLFMFRITADRAVKQLSNTLR